MRLLSNSEFDIKDYYGDIVIMYMPQAEESVRKIREKLNTTGHVYHCCVLDESILKNRHFDEDMRSVLNHCACFVPIITSSLFQPENLLFRSVLWHYIGYLRSKVTDAVVPFIPQGEKVSLSGTPIQELDIINDETVFMNTLFGKYASRLLCHNYYKNKVTNLYAARRIFYRCLRINFKIYEESFQNARQLYSEYTSRRISDSAFDSFIEENILCSCKIISFGADERLEPQMMVYKEEVHPDFSDIPQTLVGKKSYRRLSLQDSEETGIRAELTMDILLPVHRILGTYIKAYLTCLDSDCPVQLILALTEGDFTEGNITYFEDMDYENDDFWYKILPKEIFIDTQLNRMYFSLGVKMPKTIVVPDPSLKIGNYIDYIYPQ